MKILFRADASLAVGTGHVMRCRTLAAELRARGHAVAFACRALPGNLLGLLRAGGYETVELAWCTGEPDGFQRLSPQQAEADAAATLRLAGGAPDWVVVDHYGLDATWERAPRAAGARVLAIDDLADRGHDCDLLLDQNPGDAVRYATRVPASARVLAGPEWALVRPEFASLRKASLARRERPLLQRLLVFLGGGDVVSQVLLALEGAHASGIAWAGLDVVLGGGTPRAGEVEERLRGWPGARLHVQTEAMAQLMHDADVAITAGGSVSWEKCCLGLPSLVVVLSDNQKPLAAALQQAGAAVSLGEAPQPADYAAALRGLHPGSLARMAAAAAGLCAGEGVARLARLLEGR